MNDMHTFTKQDGVIAPCNGINHTDRGEIMTHDRCGATVAKREDGKVFNVRHVGRYRARKFSCWSDLHICDQTAVAMQEKARAHRVESGSIEKGCEVVVFKGRKVPKGTTGVVFWLGECNYSGKPKIGFRTKDGETIWILAEHCKMAEEVE
jgi:hypothetical protein